MPIILDHEQRTGKKVMYAFGISHADPDVMLRNHDCVVKAGGNAAVININSVGYGGLAYLRKRSNLVLHAHRNGWDILTRHLALGLDFSCLPAILAPARSRPVPDQWHQREILGIGRVLPRLVRGDEAPLFDTADCPLPVVGSGQWGGQAPETFRRTGQTLDLLYLCGGGIVSHPGGPAAGVGREAGLGGCGGGHPFGRLRAEPSGTRAIDRQVRSGRGRRMTALVQAHIHADENARANV